MLALSKAIKIGGNMNAIPTSEKENLSQKASAISRCPVCTRQVMPGESNIQLLPRIYHTSCLLAQMSNWIRGGDPKSTAGLTTPQPAA